MVRAASTLDLPLHSGLRLLVQCRRELLLRADRQYLRRGVFRSIVDFQAATNRYVAKHNTDPKLIVWTKSVRSILDKRSRLPLSE